jgi:predicted AAA+ superfamily ATPase
MISRMIHLERVTKLLKQFPVVAILGARQIGKTTLAGEIQRTWKSPCHAFDLERQADLSRLADAELALVGLKGLIVLDEIQRLPNLFPELRVLADRKPIRARFLILGSASPEMLRQGNETLAGRIAYHSLDGFSLGEVGTKNSDKLWLRGGFPRSYLASSHASSLTWRQQFVTTFLERDIPQLGIQVSSATLRRFWTMLAHYHGQVWNASAFSRSFGVADNTVRNYLDILSSAFVVRQLQPWHENIKKRQVKSPKIYLTDSGILHSLLGLRTMADLESHPQLGASWEGFVISQVANQLNVRPEECFFWATHAGAELDLLVTRGQRRWGFEIKRTSAPTVTPSMRTALTDLKLQRLFIVHAGQHSFDMTNKIRAITLSDLLEELKPRFFRFARHVWQLEGASPSSNLMEVKD